MIVKPWVPPTTQSVRESAGARAEAQMAFYLERAFGQDPQVKVLHGLRIVLGTMSDGREDAVQIDHLLVFEYGMIFIESKSVTSKVRVNERGEWSRLWNGQWRGMPSPIEQAKRQAEALVKLLGDHAEALRGKLLGLVQTRFGGCPRHVLVGISDDGVIDRPPNTAPEAMKADQVPSAALALIQKHRKYGSVLGLFRDRPKEDRDFGLYTFSPVESERVISFLLDRHQPARDESPASTDTVNTLSDSRATLSSPPTPPRSAPPTPSTPVQRRELDGSGGGNAAAPSRSAPAAPPQSRQPDRGPSRNDARVNAQTPAPPKIAPAPAASAASSASSVVHEVSICRHCQGRSLVAVRARYGWCLRCNACDKFTPFSAVCSACGEKADFERAGPKILRRCECGVAGPIWTGPIA